jgi:hypothetical protein
MRVRAGDVTLDALLEERDHLKIRINLLQDSDSETRGSLPEARSALARVEAQIGAHKSCRDA